MIFRKIDAALAAELADMDRVLVVYNAGGDIYLMGKILTNHGLSENEALDIVGYSQPEMDAAVEALGWSDWDYECIDIVYPEIDPSQEGIVHNLRAFFLEKGLITEQEV